MDLRLRRRRLDIETPDEKMAENRRASGRDACLNRARGTLGLPLAFGRVKTRKEGDAMVKIHLVSEGLI